MANASEGNSRALSSLSLDDAKNNSPARDLLARTVKKNHRARDITDEFSKACTELKTGELVKEHSFTLWSSVQALEVMDPKMDSGYVAPGEAFDSNYDVGRNLLPEELLFIMDRILCLEMAWLRGFALFQTVLTSNHIFDILLQKRDAGALPSFPLRDGVSAESREGGWLHLCLLAYCVNTIIQGEMVIELVASQQHYEEEDLNTQTYQLSRLDDITDEQSLDLLDRAIEWVVRSGETLSPIEQAILSRLELRRGSLVRHLLAYQVFDAEFLTAQAEAIEPTQSLAQPIPAAFNDKQYRKISIAAPVRAVAVLTPAESAADLAALFDSIDTQRYFLLHASVWQSPAALHVLLWTLAQRIPRPCALARAVVQNQLFGTGGPLDDPATLHAYMLAELAEAGAPTALTDGSLWRDDWPPASPRHRARERLNAWMQAARPAFLDVVRALTMNSCRMRRSLVNALAPLSALARAPEADAADADAATEAALRDAAALRKAQVATWIAQLGVAHGVYVAHELPATYLHIHKHLSSQLSILQRRRRATTTPTTAPLPAATRANLDARIAHTSALARTTWSFHAILAVLARWNLACTPPTGSLTTGALAHELRSKEYAGSRSEMADFTAFAAQAGLASTTDAGLADVLADADGALGEARTGLLGVVRGGGHAGLGRVPGLDEAWRREALGVLRAIVEMKLRVGVLRGAAAAGGGEGDAVGEAVRARVRVTIPPATAEDGRSHSWLVVPEVAARKDG